MALSARRSLTTFISRALSFNPSSSSSLIRSRYTLALLDKQYQQPFITDSRKIPTRWKSGSGYSPLNDPSPNWSNRPPKETILLDGCDYEHWLIVLEFPEPKPSEDEMIAAYIKTLASVVGSEEEAKSKIYSVCTTTYTGFGALIPEELSHKVKALPMVLWVLPDSYLDVPNKDYGGDLLVDGKVIHRPQYRFDQSQAQNNRRPRPRYDKRRETMQVERRGPVQGRNFGPGQIGPESQPNAMGGQNSFNNGAREPMQSGNFSPSQSGPASQPNAMGGQNSFNNGPPNEGDYPRGGT